MKNPVASKQQLLPFMSQITTLDEARELVRKYREEGVSCPCCDQYCKLYRRKLHTEMSLFLIRLVKRHLETRSWVHIREVITATTKASSDGAYLVHWGLVAVKEKEIGEPRAGFYKPTEKGIQFVRRQISVPSHVFIYDNKPEGFSDKMVDIEMALGSKFNYQELMRGVVF